jgi:hypothetical protein
LPVVRDLLIQDGKLTLTDDIRRLKVDGTIQAHEQKTREDPTPFRIQGTGTINDQPFELRVAGGPLVNLDPGALWRSRNQSHRAAVLARRGKATAADWPSSIGRSGESQRREPLRVPLRSP